ncbi:MAG: MFS transporter [Candidatus Thorarchaeota archaeon]|jgi:MFS family permease
MEWAESALNGIDVQQISKMSRLSLLSAMQRLIMSFRTIMLPLFVLAIGLDEAFFGLMIASAGYVQSGVLFPAGHFSDQKGRGISILIGSFISGTCLVLIPFIFDPLSILILYALTGVGSGFTMTSIETLIADYSKRGDEMTKSYGYTRTVATLAAVAGPFIAGFILDPVALPGINPVMLRYALGLFIMAGLNYITGVLGLFTERWLISNLPVPSVDPVFNELHEKDTNTREDFETSLLFGISRMIMGFSSGMAIPYLILWIKAASEADPVILGSIEAISNLTLASGTLVVGLSSERIGKLRIIGILYLAAPILMFGMVNSPFFYLMIAFYVSRNMVANMAQPASNSLFMGEIGAKRRGRSLALTRIMWTFPRQTGTLVTAALLAGGILGGIVPFGMLVFPIAMILYPVCVIPMYIAVRRNRRREDVAEASRHQ